MLLNFAIKIIGGGYPPQLLRSGSHWSKCVAGLGETKMRRRTKRRKGKECLSPLEINRPSAAYD